MNREEIQTDMDKRREEWTESVRRTLGNAPDVLSARSRVKDIVSALPGVSADPDTVPDIMLTVDFYVHQLEQLGLRVSGS